MSLPFITDREDEPLPGETLSATDQAELKYTEDGVIHRLTKYIPRGCFQTYRAARETLRRCARPEGWTLDRLTRELTELCDGLTSGVATSLDSREADSLTGEKLSASVQVELKWTQAGVIRRLQQYIPRSPPSPIKMRVRS